MQNYHFSIILETGQIFSVTSSMFIRKGTGKTTKLNFLSDINSVLSRNNPTNIIIKKTIVEKNISTVKIKYDSHIYELFVNIINNSIYFIFPTINEENTEKPKRGRPRKPKNTIKRPRASRVLSTLYA